MNGEPWPSRDTDRFLSLAASAQRQKRATCLTGLSAHRPACGLACQSVCLHCEESWPGTKDRRIQRLRCSLVSILCSPLLCISARRRSRPLFPKTSMPQAHVRLVSSPTWGRPDGCLVCLTSMMQSSLSDPSRMKALADENQAERVTQSSALDGGSKSTKAGIGGC